MSEKNIYFIVVITMPNGKCVLKKCATEEEATRRAIATKGLSQDYIRCDIIRTDDPDWDEKFRLSLAKKIKTKKHLLDNVPEKVIEKLLEAKFEDE